MKIPTITIMCKPCKPTIHSRVIARDEAIPNTQSRSVQHRDCFVPRNDVILISPPAAKREIPFSLNSPSARKDQPYGQMGLKIY